VPVIGSFCVTDHVGPVAIAELLHVVLFHQLYVRESPFGSEQLCVRLIACPSFTAAGFSTLQVGAPFEDRVVAAAVFEYAE
jgi:hypothetical protein